MITKDIAGDDTPNAEDITIKFENQSGNKFIMYYEDFSDDWVIEEEGYEGTYLVFESIREAEEAVNIIKRSVQDE